MKPKVVSANADNFPDVYRTGTTRKLAAGFDAVLVDYSAVLNEVISKKIERTGSGTAFTLPFSPMN